MSTEKMKIKDGRGSMGHGSLVKWVNNTNDPLPSLLETMKAKYSRTKANKKPG